MSKNLTLASEMLADLAELPISDRKIVVRILAAAVGAEGEDQPAAQVVTSSPPSIPIPDVSVSVPVPTLTQEPAASPKATAGETTDLMTELEQRFLLALQRNPNGISPTTLAGLIGIDVNNWRFRSLCSKLAQSKRIKTDGGGPKRVFFPLTP